MNEEMQKPQRPDPLAGLDSEGKTAFVVTLFSLPALTATMFAREKTGFRNLTPGRLFLITLIMLAFGHFVKPSASRETETDRADYTTPALPHSDVPEGLDSALPPNWSQLNYAAQSSWLSKHRLTPQQTQERQKRELEERTKLEAQAQAKAERAARWAKVRSYVSRWSMNAFALAFLGYGLYQRRARWRALLEGERWHTYCRGVPRLNKLLGRFLPETYILQFAEPATTFLVGIIVLPFSRPLGLWLMFSASALYLVEQWVYEMNLKTQLDGLDMLEDAATISGDLRHWKKSTKSSESNGAASIEENGGVLSTSASAPDLIARRAQREGRDLRNSTRETSKI